MVAKDKATNNEQKITITSSSGLSKDEVEKMAKDAESHAADDRKAKDQIEARNRADAMVYNVEKTLKEHRDKIGDDDAKAIEAALEDVKKSINDNDPEKLNAATDRLTQASHKLAEAMYKSSSQPGADGTAPRRRSSRAAMKPKNVVDAEFVDVDDKKIIVWGGLSRLRTGFPSGPPAEGQHVKCLISKRYYETLSVPRTASEDDIRKAYRKLARKYHPDLNPKTKPPRMFQNVQEAYDVLSDAKETDVRHSRRYSDSGFAAGGGGERSPEGFIPTWISTGLTSPKCLKARKPKRKRAGTSPIPAAAPVPALSRYLQSVLPRRRRRPGN